MSKKVVQPRLAVASQRRPGRLTRFNRRHPWAKVVVLLALVAGVGGFLAEHNWQPVGQLLSSLNNNSAVATMPDYTVEESSLAALKTEAAPQEATPAGAHQEQKPANDQPAQPIAAAVITPESKLIALTFDDGPSRDTTPQVLEILRQKQTRATFFVVGTMLRGAPEVAQRAQAEGHEVESHSLAHTSLATMTAEQLAADTDEMKKVFTAALGHEPQLVRPPYGAVNQLMRDTLTIPMMAWSVDSQDWRYADPAAMRAKVISDAFDGAVVLLHDIHQSAIGALPGIIDDLRTAGYTLVTVSELAAAREGKLETGILYGDFSLLTPEDDVY